MKPTPMKCHILGLAATKLWALLGVLCCKPCGCWLLKPLPECDKDMFDRSGDRGWRVSVPFIDPRISRAAEILSCNRPARHGRPAWINTRTPERQRNRNDRESHPDPTALMISTCGMKGSGATSRPGIVKRGQAGPDFRQRGAGGATPRRLAPVSWSPAEREAST